jgi:hypothetical protein
MVLTLMVICRKVFRLEHIITPRHFDYMAKIMLVTGTMVGYAYANEFFTSWYRLEPLRVLHVPNRAMGPYAWAYWTMITCNVISPQVFWFKKARTSIPILFVLSIVINIGMWFERFVIIVTSLHRDFLPLRGATSVPRSGTCRACSGASGSSSRCSACSCAFFRWWRPPSQDRPAAGRSARRPEPNARSSTRRAAAGPCGARAALRGSFAIPLVPQLPKGPLLRDPRRIRDAGGPLSRVRAGA